MDSSPHAGRARHRSASRARTPKAVRICDGVTEGVLYAMIVFAPWAFGTTERWSIWTMNVGGYILGVLLAAKWWIRWRTGNRPMRWGEAGGEETPGAEGEPQTAGIKKRSRRGLATIALAVLTVMVLAYCFTSAVNARSTFIYRQMAFAAHDYVPWLPHSYDSWATRQAFWMYLALALSFWASRDWLLGKSGSERREGRVPVPRLEGNPPGSPHSRFPSRLRRLLWVLCLNGTVLALESILQRLSGTGKLLWLVQPAINQSADLQFGPFAYRSNSAQYFNLIWPVCLGFWWTLRGESRFASRAAPRLGAGSHVLLLPCAVLLAAAPIISTSRGGALVAFVGILAAAAVLLFANRRSNWLMRLGIMLLLVITLGLASYLGWDKLGKRLSTILSDDLSGRVEIYENARQMARDFPLFGTGPGTFMSVSHLYRSHAQATWVAYAHNDWLETRITFGWVGFVLILAMLAIVFLGCLAAEGIPAHWLLVSMFWLALAGCLVHARFDFPFQIYSTLALFLLLSAALFCLSKKA
jgi:O-antigen ligase